MKRLANGSTHTVTIEKIVYHGWGLAKIEGLTVFIPHTLPGDTVDIEITGKKKRYVMGRKLATHKNSEFRETSQCQHFPQCGGCQLIDVPYSKQLELKEAILRDCFDSQFKDLNDKLSHIVPSPDPTYYRNKMDFAFAQDSNGLYFGLKERGAYDKIVKISNCQLMSADSMTICQTLCNELTQTSLTAWDYESCSGDLRHASIRHSKAHNQYMLTLIVGTDCISKLEPILKKVSTLHPGLVSVHTIINTSPGDNLYGLNAEPLSGQTHIHEKLESQEFKISPLSFFQTNSKGAERLYEETRKAAQLQAKDTVLDLYCGTGTIGLSMAPHVKQVIGIEENPSATADAAQNADLNKLSNIEFRTGRVKNILKFENLSADVVVVDPPRSGLVPKALRRTAELKAPRLVYVSCNPVTLCRDLKDFHQLGYDIEEIVGIDMFPNTYHIETVTRLKLRD